MFAEYVVIPSKSEASFTVGLQGADLTHVAPQPNVNLNSLALPASAFITVRPDAPIHILVATFS